MPIKCRMIDIEEYRKQGKQPQPGDMWYAPWYIEKDGVPCSYLTEEYKRDWMSKRLPLVVMLPCKEGFLVDSRCMVNGKMLDHGWKVTGEVPNITVSPSINFIGRYHGWLQNGILSDDIEGRKY